MNSVSKRTASRRYGKNIFAKEKKENRISREKSAFRID
jgi:hypothetical protein